MTVYCAFTTRFGQRLVILRGGGLAYVGSTDIGAWLGYGEDKRDASPTVRGTLEENGFSPLPPVVTSDAQVRHSRPYSQIKMTMRDFDSGMSLVNDLLLQMEGDSAIFKMQFRDALQSYVAEIHDFEVGLTRDNLHEMMRLQSEELASLLNSAGYGGHTGPWIRKWFEELVRQYDEHIPTPPPIQPRWRDAEDLLQHIRDQFEDEEVLRDNFTAPIMKYITHSPKPRQRLALGQLAEAKLQTPEEQHRWLAARGFLFHDGGEAKHWLKTLFAQYRDATENTP